MKKDTKTKKDGGDDCGGWRPITDGWSSGWERDYKRIIPQCHCCIGFWWKGFLNLNGQIDPFSLCVSFLYQIVIARERDRDSSECLVGARRCHTAVAMLNNSYKKAAGRRECIRERKNLIVTSCRYSNSKKKKKKNLFISNFFHDSTLVLFVVVVVVWDVYFFSFRLDMWNVCALLFLFAGWKSK
jgi:hypothetical protein